MHFFALRRPCSKPIDGHHADAIQIRKQEQESVFGFCCWRMNRDESSNNTQFSHRGLILIKNNNLSPIPKLCKDDMIKGSGYSAPTELWELRNRCAIKINPFEEINCT